MVRGPLNCTRLAGLSDDEDLSTKTALEQLDQLGAAVAALAAAPSDKSTAAAVAIVFPQAQAVTETLLQAHQLAHTLTDIEQADQVRFPDAVALFCLPKYKNRHGCVDKKLVRILESQRIIH